MKTSTMPKLRAAVAASGVALLMFVAGCGGSDDADTSGDDTAAEETTDAGAAEETATEEEVAEEDVAEEESAADEETAEEDSAEDEEAAAGVASPDADFDPCTAISAEDVNGVLGSDLGEGTSGDMAGVAMCTFTNASTGASVIVQWAGVEASLDDALKAMTDLYSDLGEPEEVTVAAAEDAAVLTGEISGFDATILIATANGGFLQVVATAEDMDSDQAAQIAEAALAGA